MSTSVRTEEWRRPGTYLNRALEFLPDRLSESQWIDRCRIIGLGRVQEARECGRPVVLAFCHFGPYALLRPWLRAVGVPVSVLVRGRSGRRTKVKRLTDSLSPFPAIPAVLHRDRLREVVEFLEAGCPLLMAVDSASGRQIAVPIDENWTFEMSTGAIRLAIRYQAELIPCSIIEDGDWRFRIELGPAVPREHLSSEKDLMFAGRHLMAELFTHLKQHPEQYRGGLIHRFKRSASTARSTPELK